MLNLLVAWIGGGEIRFLQEGDLRIVSLNLSQAMNKLFGTCCAPSGSGICLTRQMVAFFLLLLLVLICLMEVCYMSLAKLGQLCLHSLQHRSAITPRRVNPNIICDTAPS